MVNIGERYGCLKVLDEGIEFLRISDEHISAIRDEKSTFIAMIQDGKLAPTPIISSDESGDHRIPGYMYVPKTFTGNSLCITIEDFDKAISRCLQAKEEPHYKCLCKCGKTRYYTEETLLSKPGYCYYPKHLGCSRYSYSAKEASKRVQETYRNNEAVLLTYDKDLFPSDDYCDIWNNKRRKNLEDKGLPTRPPEPKFIHAKHYDDDFAGMIYDSLKIMECVSCDTEDIYSDPFLSLLRRPSDSIYLSKEYRCRCYLCGQTQVVSCDQFDISLDCVLGYTSSLYCPCRNPDELTSFHWLVTKILFENKVNYRVEYSFENLTGVSGKYPLRYDFAVFKADGSIKCLIECQGEQHTKPIYGDDQLEKQKIHDERKRHFASDHGIPLIEIVPKDKTYEKVCVILKDAAVIQ